MEKFTTLTSRAVPLLVDDIDTDQIIPARFLKVTSKAGLGKLLFYDWRYDAKGEPQSDFVLNRREHEGSRILVAKNNFGCGSSREHAPWALQDFGFGVIIAGSFADIFRNNALKNGLLPVGLAKDELFVLEDLFLRGEPVELTVDLEGQRVSVTDGPTFSFEIDPFAKTCLQKGMDQLEYLTSHEAAIASYEAQREAAP